VGSYRSNFRDWDVRSTVRGAPRRLVDDGNDDDLWFSPDVVPVAHHPLVASLGEEARRDLLTHALYMHLGFTSCLEHQIVNVVLERIAHGRVAWGLPDEMRLDAHRIYCDEAYHALFSFDLQSQVVAASGVVPCDGAAPSFLDRFRDSMSCLPPDLSEHAETFFAVVSETVRSKTFRVVPEDERVHSVVRHVIDDHARDEAYHKQFFTRVLRNAWPRLSHAERREIGMAVPRFIHDFLSPDHATLRSALELIGVSARDARRVVNESHPHARTRRHVSAAARTTIRAMRSVGAFEDPRILDAFGEAELLIDDTGHDEP